MVILISQSDGKNIDRRFKLCQELCKTLQYCQTALISSGKDLRQLYNSGQKRFILHFISFDISTSFINIQYMVHKARNSFLHSIIVAYTLHETIIYCTHYSFMHEIDALACFLSPHRNLLTSQLQHTKSEVFTKTHHKTKPSLAHLHST